MKTLHPELQALLDRMVDHLAAQKARALGPFTGCRYRGINGSMCAVGCLIPDELYHPDIEGELYPFFDPENHDEPFQAIGAHLTGLAPSIRPDAIEQFLTLMQAYHDVENNDDPHNRFINLAATCNYTRAMAEAAPDQLRERIAADLASLISRCTDLEWFA